jgi:hypothetical protein
MSRTEEECIRILTGKPEGKRLLGRSTCGLEGNIKVNHREIGWVGMDWIKLVQDRD